MAEVGNHILLHLSGSKITDLSPPVSTLSENEIKSLQYLSGYIIHKFYTKFQFSKNRESEFNRQCVAILQACKIDSDRRKLWLMFVTEVVCGEQMERSKMCFTNVKSCFEIRLHHSLQS